MIFQRLIWATSFLTLLTLASSVQAAGRNCRDWDHKGRPDPREYVCEGAKIIICPNNIYKANKCRLVTIESISNEYKTGYVPPLTVETYLKSTTYVVRDEHGQRMTLADGMGSSKGWSFFALKGCVESTRSDASFCVGEQMTDAESVQDGEGMVGPGKLVALELGMGGSYSEFGVIKTADGYKQIWAQGMYMTDSRQELNRMNKKEHDEKYSDPWKADAK